MSDIITTGNKQDKWTLKVTELLNWLNDNKSAVLVAGDNITLTPKSDGRIEISAEGGGGGGDVTDVQIDSTSILDQYGVANITTMQGATSQTAGTKGLVPVPAVADKDKFLKGDGTWSEAGGGNVDDVVMNGQSIVTNKVASFQNYVELTQAEYDALPNSKLTDGILYCIKDIDPASEMVIAPIVYSLEEREVGVWIDGKTLYQRTWVWTNYQIASGENSLSLGNIPFETLCYSIAFITNSLHTTIRPLNTRDSITPSEDLWYVVNLSDKTLRIMASTSWSTPNIYVTLRYTKTTDIAGSGIWAQDGVPAVHYDGNEKIIGTWLDRATGASVPLYEKLIRFGSNGSSGKNSSDINTNILSNLNIRECIDCYFVIWQDSIYRKHQLYYNSSTQLLSNYPSNSWTTHLVVRYTKSS